MTAEVVEADGTAGRPAPSDRSVAGVASPMVVTGAVLVALSAVIGVALPLVAGARRDAAVEGLARAPAGCVTVLDVARAGVYVVYVETRGRLEPVSGSCIATARRYDLDRPPRVQVDIVDPSGLRVPLQGASGPSYDAPDAAGRGVRNVELSQRGSHRMTVASTDPDAVVAVGADVSAVGTTLRRTGFGLGAGGVLVGAALMIRGVAAPSRRGRTR